MKARLLGLTIFSLLSLAAIATFRAGNASSRCVDSITYTTEIPTEPGRENAYNVPLPDIAGEDQIVACTAFMTLPDVALLHFGFDQQSECQGGYCTAGMEMGKYANDMAFSFWWEAPAEAPPVEVEVYYRECWGFEYCGPQTPTATPNGTPKHDEPQTTPAPTGQPSSWMPLILKPWQHPDVTLGPAPDPRLTPQTEVGS